MSVICNRRSFCLSVIAAMLTPNTASAQEEARPSLERPRPSTPYIGIFGDSRGYDNHYTDGGRSGETFPAEEISNRRDEKCARGFAAFIECLTNGRVELPRSLNFAIAGENTSQMADRCRIAMRLMASRGASAVILIGSTNDRGGSIGTNDSIKNLLRIEAEAIDAGLTVIWIAEEPRGNKGSGNFLSPVLMRDHQAVRNFLLSRHNGVTVFVADPWPQLVDVNSANGYVKEGYSRDGLHLNAQGNLFVAKTISPIVESLWTPRNIFPSSNSDIFSYELPGGSLIPNPMLSGYRGHIASGAKGAIADGWTQSPDIPDGLSIVNVKSVENNGLNKQSFKVRGKPNPLASFDLIRKDVRVDDEGLILNRAVRAIAEVEVESDAKGVLDVHLAIHAGDKSCKVFSADPSPFTSIWPKENVRGAWITPSLVVPKDADYVRTSLSVYLSGQPADVTISVRRISLEIALGL